jgi:hypothetical protein
LKGSAKLPFQLKKYKIFLLNPEQNPSIITISGRACAAKNFFAHKKIFHWVKNLFNGKNFLLGKNFFSLKRFFSHTEKIYLTIRKNHLWPRLRGKKFIGSSKKMKSKPAK